MKVSRMTLAGLITVIGLAAGLVTATAPAGAAPQRPAVAMRHVPPRLGGPARPIPAAPSARTQRVTLPPAQCAALRRSLRHPSASCAVVETLRVSAIRKVGTSTYYDGYLQACENLSSFGYCDQSSGQWYVMDYFNFTVNTGTDQVWNNGHPSCGNQDTTVQWCAWSGNGTSTLSEGFNFDHNHDYARMFIYGYGAFSTAPNYSWENECGGALPSDQGFGCTT